MNSIWVIKEGHWVLWCWLVHFDLYTKNLDKRHLWLLLPVLPLQFWTRDILVNLVNHVGKLIFINPSMLWEGERTLEKVLVEFKMGDGLPDGVNIIWGGKSFK